MKAKMLKQVDNFLFAQGVKSLAKIYATATALNRGEFTYFYFTAALIQKENSLVGYTSGSPPSEKTIEYLKPFYEEYLPFVKQREKILAYLLQFLNQCNNTFALKELLPSDIGTTLQWDNRINAQPECDIELINLFKQREEYKMICAQLVFKTMGL